MALLAKVSIRVTWQSWQRDNGTTWQSGQHGKRGQLANLATDGPGKGGTSGNLGGQDGLQGQHGNLWHKMAILAAQVLATLGTWQLGQHGNLGNLVTSGNLGNNVSGAFAKIFLSASRLVGALLGVRRRRYIESAEGLLMENGEACVMTAVLLDVSGQELLGGSRRVEGLLCLVLERRASSLE